MALAESSHDVPDLVVQTGRGCAEREREIVYRRNLREREAGGRRYIAVQGRAVKYSTAQCRAGQGRSIVQYSTGQGRAGQDGNFKTRDRVTECVKAVTTYYIL